MLYTVAAAVLFFMIAFSNQQFTKAIHEENQRMVMVIGNQLAGNLTVPLITKDYPELNRLIEEIVNKNGVNKIVLFDLDGNEVAAAGKSEEKPQVRVPVIINNQEKSGELSITYDSNREKEIVQKQQVFMMLWFLAAMIILTTIAFYRAKRERGYLEILIKAFSRATTGSAESATKIQELIEKKLGKDGASAILEQYLGARIDEAQVTVDQRTKIVGEELARKNLIDFFAKLAHDLRTPTNHINILSGSVSNLIETGNYKEALKHSRQIFEASNTLTDMYETSMDLSLISSGKNPNIKIESFNPIEVIDAEIEIHSNQAARELIKFNAFISKKMPTTCVGDGHALKRALKNLLTNAIKYNRPGGRVFCSARVIGSDIVVDVYDQGIGISEKDKKLIFNQFNSIRNNSNVDSSGLGLYIAKTFIKAGGGDVNLIGSTEGSGSHFRATLPFSRPSWRKLACNITQNAEVWVVSRPNKTRNYIQDVLMEKRESQCKIFETLVDVAKYGTSHHGPAIILVPDRTLANELAGAKGLFSKEVKAIFIGSDCQDEDFWFEIWPIFSLRQFKRTFAKRRQEEKIQSGKNKILFVDDDDLNREIMPGHLAKELGIDEKTIVTAASGKEALSMMDVNPFPMVITDHMMPMMMGTDVAQTIKERWPETVIAVMTANATTSVRQEYQSIGVDIFVSKPARSEELNQLKKAVEKLDGCIVDSGVVYSRRGGDFEQRIAVRSQEWISQLLLCAQEKDTHQCKRITHQAIGTSGVSQSTRWVGFFQRIEKIILNGDWDGAIAELKKEQQGN